MDRNAFVTWAVHLQPWAAEDELLGRLSLPLNLAGNRRHPFHPTLRAVRAEAKRRARSQQS